MPRGDERLLIPFLGRHGLVLITICRATILIFTAVANVRCPDKLLALERYEVRTETAAVALFAELSAALVPTDILFSAGLCELTVIRCIIESYCLLAYPVSFDFLRYCSRISVQVVAYLFEA